ncbi:MAG: DUF4838 domain-containing protein [Actinomycetota bacterium]|nr:DUF4838 domain-containing protein [Actinomycetota bacterium]
MLSRIINLSNNKTLDFATTELKRYLERFYGVKIYLYKEDDLKSTIKKYGTKNIIIGSFDNFPLITDDTEILMDEDQIWVKLYKENLIITGSNDRSVLFSVYTLLKKAGFDWIYPGEEGEVFNRAKNFNLFNVDIHNKAYLKFRGIVIEGGVKFPQLLDFIDWMAKKCMNHFFMQFQSCYNFYKWFDPSITMEKAREYDQILISEIKKRGMLFERVGHGWISRSLGLSTEGWYKTKEKISKGKKKYVAKVNGRRDLWKGVALNTQICMTNNEAVDKMIDYICRYAGQHPEVDILAFWLADEFNNLCECSECRKHSPSDLYIRIINKLSKKIYKVNPKMKLEVIVYANILEPPLNEKIDNSNGNVILVFAPITRCWTHTLNDHRCIAQKPLKFWPELNKVGEVKNSEYMEFFKGWLKNFDGDNYIFDYYNWIWGCRDFIITEMPKVISMDLKSYEPIGIKGVASCGTERAFWPTGISMNVLAGIAWDRTAEYKEIEIKYLEAAFGDESSKAKEYIHKLYNLIVDEDDYSQDHNYKTWYEELMPKFKDKKDKLLDIILKLKERKPWLENKYNKSTDKIIKKRWFYLITHLNFLIIVFEAKLKLINNEKENALAGFREIKKYFEHNRAEIEDVLDIFDINYRFLDSEIKKITG